MVNVEISHIYFLENPFMENQTPVVLKHTLWLDLLKIKTFAKM